MYPVSALADDEKSTTWFDVGIVGGGLAGLSLAILLAKKKYNVILFEKEKYPFHRVCGEYISFESKNFIESLGLDLSQYHLPVLKKLIVSSPNGNSVNANLDLGGFGVSRSLIDNELKKLALLNGVKVFEETKVNDVIFNNDSLTVRTNNMDVDCTMVVGSFGKRSNLDVKFSRDFIKKRPGKLNNYIGVKYHIKTVWPPDTIALHNFRNGYCGISKIEDEKYCLCYLTTANNLKECNNSIHEMEQQILCKNPALKKIFSKSQFVFPAPVTISQISFDKKLQVENHMLLVGDAAGMITPLCGNGMSMAFHSSKLAFECIDDFMQGKINRDELEVQYKKKWNKTFSTRLGAGRMIQSWFGKERSTNLFIGIMKHLPFAVNAVIKATHGKEF